MHKYLLTKSISLSSLYDLYLRTDVFTFGIFNYEIKVDTILHVTLYIMNA